MSIGNLLFYLAAFAIALGLLVVVHEFGHYAMARACGVKVVRFSVGFGRPVWSRRIGRDGTEWAIGAFPLGGYVKMLDEGEGAVAPEELPRAFNRQPVWKRMLIVAAGPTANLLLAVLLYWGLFLHGVQEIRPVLAAPPAGTPAAVAGVANGDTVRAVNGTPVSTWQDLRWEILNVALGHGVANLQVETRDHKVEDLAVDLRSVRLDDLEGDLLREFGLELYRPRLKPILDTVMPGSPGAAAGLRAGDELLAIDGRPVPSTVDVTQIVRGAADRPVEIEFLRDGRTLQARVVPEAVVEHGKRFGRIGVAFRSDPAAMANLIAEVRYAPGAALAKAAARTWETADLCVRLIGRMLTGAMSWKNLSGPVTIADYAGQSAHLGLGPYLGFLALISVSLGVLNLLPIPVLDGGHLMYHLAELIRGGPLPERVVEIGQQIGLALLAVLMIFALYNDINRLISG